MGVVGLWGGGARAREWRTGLTIRTAILGAPVERAWSRDRWLYAEQSMHANVLVVVVVVLGRLARASEFPERECCEPVYPLPAVSASVTPDPPSSPATPDTLTGTVCASSSFTTLGTQVRSTNYTLWHYAPPPSPKQFSSNCLNYCITLFVNALWSNNLLRRRKSQLY